MFALGADKNGFVIGKKLAAILSYVRHLNLSLSPYTVTFLNSIAR